VKNSDGKTQERRTGVVKIQGAAEKQNKVYCNTTFFVPISATSLLIRPKQKL